MLLFYNVAVKIYYYIICVVATFNKKAKLWVDGRKIPVPNSEVASIWFHFASLGEFEQGRPVLEQIRGLCPEDKIVITFFSPSGYEIRKNTPLADAVYYLPLDTPKNARRFIKAIKPKFAVFTKYEYWYHFLNEAHNSKIPVYIISGIFRPGQVFFKWYGSLHRKILSFVSYFFVQDEQSKQLLAGLGINNVQVSGDTRFDRVWENARHPKNIPFINEFKNGQKLFVAGSTWLPDEKLLSTLITNYPDWKFIIAPHEIAEEKVNNVINLLPKNSALKYSQLTTSNLQLTTCQTLIIDNIGMLSFLYQYGDIAYIGGGFGAGIHNTAEAAAFGLPVIFGPNYSKFKEAYDLIELNAGFSIMDEDALKQVMDYLVSDEAVYRAASDKIYNYVKEQKGATKTIIEFINTNVL